MSEVWVFEGSSVNVDRSERLHPSHSVTKLSMPDVELTLKGRMVASKAVDEYKT